MSVYLKLVLSPGIGQYGKQNFINRVKFWHKTVAQISPVSPLSWYQLIEIAKLSTQNRAHGVLNNGTRFHFC